MSGNTTVIPDPNGEVAVIESGVGGIRTITVTPNDTSLFVPIRTCKTTYSLELIKKILNVKGLAWVCDEVARDEDPGYVEIPLLTELNAYFPPGHFHGKRILDFGCGSGASTSVLARNFPDSEIIGIELVGELISIANARASHHGYSNVTFMSSPNGTELPPTIGTFHIVIMSAVYEHLLPEERGPIMERVWRAIRPGGALFLDQTPNMLFPIELHTTGLPLINYVPDGLASSMAKRFSRRITPTDSWKSLLRQGIRGATVNEILGNIPDGNARLVLLEPIHSGLRDRVDLWYANTTETRHRILKRSAKLAIKVLYRLTGITMIPDLSLAIQKRDG
jgi:2-polyprenyl-3-methyl-5-hydroxy-6-metoxy-1,4-benzoquinol methylase